MSSVPGPHKESSGASEEPHFVLRSLCRPESRIEAAREESRGCTSPVSRMSEVKSTRLQQVRPAKLLSLARLAASAAAFTLEIVQAEAAIAQFERLSPTISPPLTCRNDPTNGAASPDRPRGSQPVARPELGVKRQCMNCGAKFYDLQKNPAVCPKCGTEQPAETQLRRRGGGNVAEDKRPKKPSNETEEGDDSDVRRLPGLFAM